MIRKKTPYRIENRICKASSLVSLLDMLFFQNWMGSIQVPFYSKNWPTNFISIESYAQVLYSIELIPRRIIYIYTYCVYVFIPHIIVWGSCFSVVRSCLRPSRCHLLPLRITHSVTQLFHTQLCQNTQLLHTKLCHTELFH